MDSSFRHSVFRSTEQIVYSLYTGSRLIEDQNPPSSALFTASKSGAYRLIVFASWRKIS